jgi:subtilase family serine protease
MPQVRRVGRARNHNYAYQSLQPHATGGYSPAEMAALYGWPKLTGTIPQPQTIALIELGGGYSAAAIAAKAAQWGLPAPMITDLSVDGATNSYTGDPQSADVEVELDICCAMAYSYSTGTPARILMVWCPNSDTGFPHGIQAAAAHPSKPSACGISWGMNEHQSTPAYVASMDAAFQAANAASMTCCCASGDAGDSDGTTSKVCDYPSSSPYVVGCGGTSIVVQGNQITNETPWNASGAATGGGYSDLETMPAWQAGITGLNGRRGVPDLCAMGAPQNGWDTPFGPIGGTSAVAPFMAGFFAVCNAVREARGMPRLGWANAALYANHAAFYDITVGNNTLARPNYDAGLGWDPASGLGALRAAKLFPLLTAGVTPPPPPPPVAQRYSCVGGQCIPDQNGAFATLADCMANCHWSPPPPPGPATLRQRFATDFADLISGTPNQYIVRVWQMLAKIVDSYLAQHPMATLADLGPIIDAILAAWEAQVTNPVERAAIDAVRKVVAALLAAYPITIPGT